MADSKLPRGQKHRLLVYFRMGQRLRIGPLFIALLALLLLAATYIPDSVLALPWLVPGRRPFIIGLLVVSVALYLLTIFISRVSFVQARSDYLYVRAGIIPIVVSYSRIQRLRPVQVGKQHPRKSLRGRERALLRPLMGNTAAAVDLREFPMGENTLRRLWNKFMFVTDEKGILLIVKESMVLLNEIDDHHQDYRQRKSSRGEMSKDVFERIAARYGGE